MSLLARRAAAAIVIAGSLLPIAASTASAAPVGNGGANKTKTELEKEGYKCEDMGIQGIYCTAPKDKNGNRVGPDYLCDRQSKVCSSVRLTSRPTRPTLPAVPTQPALVR
jgi:hypothetical protein